MEEGSLMYGGGIGNFFHCFSVKEICNASRILNRCDVAGKNEQLVNVVYKSPNGRQEHMVDA